MFHIVAPGESLWSIAAKHYGSGEKWTVIASANNIRNPNMLFAGQKLWIEGGKPAAQSRIAAHMPQQHGPMPGAVVPANTYVFVLADEIDPLRRKVVRRVLVSPKMAAEVSQRIGKPLAVFPHPERFGFTATGPKAQVSMGRHALGMKPSPFSSASTRIFGATRFTGTPFWIDAARAEMAGATIHETGEIIADLDRILKKTSNPDAAKKINTIKGLVASDAEVLVRGNVPASAIKGPTAMAATRVLQGVQVVGFTISAYNMYDAGRASIETRSARPITAETVRQVGGWGAAWAGMKLGAAGGALVGIETGPGAVVTAAIGGIAGGVAGYYGFDWIADHIHEN